MRQCLTYNYILDDKNSAQYMVDAIHFDDPDDIAESTAAFFQVDGQCIVRQLKCFTERYLGFPRVVDIHKDADDTCIPLGHWTTMEDKIYALANARLMLAKMVELEPSHVIQH
jgi:hypothetical protein